MNSSKSYVSTAWVMVLALFLSFLAAMIPGCSSKVVVKKDPEEIAASAGERQITAISTSETSDSASVFVTGNELLTYTSIKQDLPLGVILYLTDTALGDIEKTYTPESTVIGVINASELTAKGKTTRIEIALKKDVPYEVTREGTGLKISFEKPLETAGTTDELQETAIEDSPVAESISDDAATLETAVEAKKEEAVEASKDADSPAAVAEAEPSGSAMSEVTTAGDQKAVVVPAADTASAATRMMAVNAEKLENSFVLTIAADGAIRDYKSFTIKKSKTLPARIVFDLMNIKSPYKKEQQIPVDAQQVQKVRHFGYSNKVRLVMETDDAYLSHYYTTVVDNGLVIHVGEEPRIASAAALSEAPETATVSEPAQPATPVEETLPAEKMEAESPQPDVTAVSDAKDGPAWVNRIDFTSEDAGKSTVIIGTTSPVKYNIRRVADKLLELKLYNTRIPKYRRHQLITTRFESAVDRIIPVPKQTADNASAFTIELRENVPYVVKQADSLLQIHFSPSSIPPKPLDDRQLPAWKKVIAKTDIPPVETAPEKISGSVPDVPDITNQPEVPVAPIPAVPDTPPAPAVDASKLPTTVAPDISKKADAKDVVLGKKPQPVAGKFTGEKIALDFYDTDIKNVFRILREVSGKNFAIDKDVRGRVTLTLEKPVPWDQVLDLVLRMNQLGYIYEGEIIRIATIKTIQQERKLRLDKLAAEQKANKVKKELEPLVTEYFSINYSDASADILPHLNKVKSKRGVLSVAKHLNMVIMTDVAQKIEQARDLILTLDQVTPQVIIEARVVEADTSFTRDFGISYGITGGPREVGNISGDLDYSASVDLSSVALGTLGFNFSRITGTPFAILDAQLTASETEGYTKIISSPKIVTLDNKQATIKQGVRWPTLTRDDAGNTVVKYENIDLLLDVTPHVTPDSRISMQINVKKNDLGQEVGLLGNTSFTTNEAVTELLVNDGDTVVIGGIVKTTNTNSKSGIPGLKDIPVINWLFRSTGVDNAKKELLIFIAPRIVQLEQASTQF